MKAYVLTSKSRTRSTTASSLTPGTRRSAPLAIAGFRHTIHSAATLAEFLEHLDAFLDAFLDEV